MGGNVIIVSSHGEFVEQVSGSKGFGGKPVIVDFTASWCGPCKAIAPIYDQLSAMFPAITFLKVDVDELQEVAQQCGIAAMPTFQAYYNGSKVDEMKGADPAKLKAMVEQLAARATSMGAGQKLGGSSGSAAAAAPAQDDATARRAMMAAAAEARMKALQGGS